MMKSATAVKAKIKNKAEGKYEIRFFTRGTKTCLDISS